MIPIISVIVPVFNVEKYLEKCLDSIVNQTVKDLEILVVDDGSTDLSGEICDRYMERDTRIKVFHKENAGLSSARNYGIDRATGKYIGFVDSDDYIDKDMYELLLRLVEKNDADLSMCGLYDIYNDKPRKVFQKEETIVIDKEKAIKTVLEAEKVSVTAVNKLYRRDLFSEIRYPEGKTAEDAFIIIEILDKCRRVVISTEQKYYYIHRTNSITTSAFSNKVLDTIEAYKKNYDLIRRNYPDLLDVAQMRMCWAYFYVLDRLVFDNSGKYEQVKKNTVDYLNAHLSFILTDKRFHKTRKFSALMLRINWRLYKYCVILQNRRYRIG